MMRFVSYIITFNYKYNDSQHIKLIKNCKKFQKTGKAVCLVGSMTYW